MVGFEVGDIKTNETGTWNIVMTLIDENLNIFNSNMTRDTVVTRAAGTDMKLLSSSGIIVINNSTHIEARPGTQLNIRCSSTRGRPEVTQYTWTINNAVWSHQNFSDVIFMDADPQCPNENCRYKIFKKPYLFELSTLEQKYQRM